MERLRFKSPEGLSLAGFLEVRGKKAPTIILCHSKGNSHKLDILEKLAKFLLDNNLNVFRFDFRGHGESQKAPLSYGWYERSDVIGAANYLLARKDIDHNKIVGFGISFGAAALILAAAECKGIKAVISESTYPRFEDHCKYTIKGKIFLPGTPEQQAFLSNLKNKLNISEDIAPINCVQKIAPRPILIMHGDADTDIPISAARNLYEKALSPKEFWVIKGGGHNDCYYVDPEKYNQKVLGFIGQNIC